MSDGNELSPSFAGYARHLTHRVMQAAGIATALSMAGLGAPAAHAASSSLSFNGTVTIGQDLGNTFGNDLHHNLNLAQDRFNLDCTVDDSKGTGRQLDKNPSGVVTGSHVYSLVSTITRSPAY
jgi:hypothetical protein